MLLKFITPTIVSRHTALWCLLLALFAVCGCSDKSTEPDADSTLGDYPVYFVNDIYHTKLYEYVPGTDQLDSIDLPAPCNGGLAVSPDGRTVFVYDGHANVYAVDLQSRSVSGTINFPGSPTVSPDGKVLILSHQGVGIFDAHTLQPIHVIDSLDVGKSSVRGFGTRLYVPDWGFNTGPVYRIDLSSPEFPVTAIQVNHLLPDSFQLCRAFPSHDERLLYCYYGGGPLWAFAVIDLQADSLLFNRWLAYNLPPSFMATTPRDQRVFVAHPGNSQFNQYLPPPAEFLVYEVRTGDCWAKVANGANIPIHRPPYVVDTMPVGQMVVTPDGNWLICTHAGWKAIITYDTQTLEPVHRYYNRHLPPNFLTCQGN